MPPPDRTPSRRAVLGVPVAGLAVSLTACSGGSGKAAAGTSTSTKGKPPEPPDVRVAGEAVAAITATRTQLGQVRTAYPGLAGLVGRYDPMHAAHLRTLAHAVPKDATTPGATPTAAVRPTSRARARAAVVRAERTLAATLTGLAMRAQSGDFARLLASMVAAIDQRLVQA